MPLPPADCALAEPIATLPRSARVGRSGAAAARVACAGRRPGPGLAPVSVAVAAL